MSITILIPNFFTIKLNTPILFLFLNLILFQNICEAQNLALHKSYQFSIQPDYSYSDRSADKTSLTDGIYTTGRFWTPSTTVGWQSGKDVSITIDLEKIAPIQAVTFNTVRAIKSGIYFPQSIFVFISDDNNTFRYVGDAADDPQNLPGENKVKKFVLDNIDQSARYIKLTVIPQSPYIFCDEIEVLQGRNNFNVTTDSFPQSSLIRLVDSLKLLGYEKKALTKVVARMGNTLAIKTGTNEEEIARLAARLNSKSLSRNNFKIIKEDILTMNINSFKHKFKTPFIIEKYNPWDSLNEFREPTMNSSELIYHFLLCNGFSQYGSFVITNSSLTPQKFYFKVSNNASINNIELYNVPYVPSLYYDRIPDPLVKIENSIIINPGVSEMFLFEITGVKTGNASSSIIISSNKKNAKINIQSHILNPFQQNKFESLNVNVWAYLNKPMLISHKADAVKDLKLHHVNTFVIPPEILPGLGNVDFNSFNDYLANFGESKNILLSMGYASLANRMGLKKVQFMSEEWKKYFIQWYANIKGLINDHGFSNTQIYLYPYDEIEAKNIEDFKNLILWAKKAIPGIKFYATLNNRTAVDSILPVIDVAQIAPSLAEVNNLPFHHCEIWIYSGQTPSRAQSPYGYYRMMAWDAFVNDYKGIGFWNYADERNGNKLNLISDSLPNLSGSYSVIYNDPDGRIVSSRRWEAFRLGIEDYSILQAYSKKYGIQNAKALASQVVNKPEDLNLADSVRNKIIISLSGK